MTQAQKEYQADYMRAVELGNAPDGAGVVVDYFGEVDRMGGIALVVVFDTGNRLSPYYNPSPEADELKDVEDAAHEWADGMSGATEWGNWEWVAY